MTVTCHSVNREFKLSSAFLKHELSSIVTDNDATMEKACELLEMNHFPCFAHLINLLVQEIFKMDVLATLLGKCMKAFTKRRSIIMAKFKLAQQIEPTSEIEPHLCREFQLGEIAHLR